MKLHMLSHASGPSQLISTMQVRKAPPEHVQGQVLYSLSHKDLKSLVNQAVDALK